MIHHAPRNEESKVCQLSSIYPCTSFECCVASMEVIIVPGCLCIGVSTLYMYLLIIWEGFQHLYGLLKLMVHNITHNPKAEVESVPIFIPQHIEYPWNIIWSVLMLPPACSWWIVHWYINLTHASIDEFREVTICPWMIEAQSSAYTNQVRG